MKKYLVTYSNNIYSVAREYCLKMGKEKGQFDKIIRYTPQDIDSIFAAKNHDILNLKHGNGLWLWKPYFVYKALCSIEEGDFLMYCDAASFFIRSAQYIIDSMESDDIWVSDLPFIEKQFTNPSLFQIMGCDSTEYKETNQIQASFIAFRKTDKTVEFVSNWLHYCERPECIYMENNVHVEGFKFYGHRFDQSILSLLCKKNMVQTHMDPSQFGRIPAKYYYDDRFMFRIPKHNNEYPVCIILHRSKDINKRKIFNAWFCVYCPKWLITVYIFLKMRLKDWCRNHKIIELVKKARGIINEGN